MSKLNDTISSKINFNKKVRFKISKEILNLTNIEKIKKLINGVNVSDTIIKTIEAYAYNKFDMSKTILEQINYNESSKEFYNKLIKNSEYIKEDESTTVIEIELWKISVCVNNLVVSDIKENDIYNEVIKWGIEIEQKINGSGN